MGPVRRLLSSPWLILLQLAAVVVACKTGHPGLALGMAAIQSSLPLADMNSLNTIAASFKEYMTQDKVWSTIADENPELTIISKDNTQGLYTVVPVDFGGSSSTTLGNGYANSLGNQKPNKRANFHVPMDQLWDLSTIQIAALEAAKSRAGSYEDLIKSNMRDAFTNCGNRLTRAIMSSGTATWGTIATIQVNPPNFPAGSARVTLTSQTAYIFAEYLATIDVTAVDGGPPLGAPDTVQVLAKSVGSQYVVFSAPINSVTGNASGAWAAGYWIAGNFLINDGDYNATGGFGSNIVTSSGPPGVGYTPASFAGMGAWCPSYKYRINPGLGSQTFFGVPRQVDEDRLSGMGLDRSNIPVDRALIDAAITMTLTSAQNSAPEYCSLNTTSYTALVNILQSQKNYYSTPDVIDEKAEIAYEWIYLSAAGKRLKIIPSRNTPARTAYLWSPMDWELGSMGDVPRIIPYNDWQYWPLQDAPAYQFRAGGFPNLILRRMNNVANVWLQQ